jgi:hypothetical protein
MGTGGTPFTVMVQVAVLLSSAPSLHFQVNVSVPT